MLFYGPAISENVNTVVYVKLTDQAGNASLLSTDGILLDTEGPEISSLEVPAEMIRAKSADITFKVSAEGSWYYVVVSGEEPAQISKAADVICTVDPGAAGAEGGTAVLAPAAKGSGTVTAEEAAETGGTVAVTLRGLAPGETYQVYAAAADSPMEDISGDAPEGAQAVNTEFTAVPAEFTTSESEIAVSVETGTYRVSKVYDGTTDAGTGEGELSVTGILETDTGVTVTAEPEEYEDPNVGGQNEVAVKLALTGEGSENYRLERDVIQVPCEITPMEIVPVIRVTETCVYNGTPQTPEFTVSYAGSDGVEVTVEKDQYTASFADNIDAGTARILVTPKEGANYTWNSPAEGTFTIEKAEVPGLVGHDFLIGISVKRGSKLEYDMSSLLPEGSVIGNVTITDVDNILEDEPTVNGTVVSCRMVNDVEAVGDEAVITINITDTKNYRFFNLKFTVLLLDKTPRELSFASDTLEKSYGDEPFVNPLSGVLEDLALEGLAVSYRSSDPSVAAVDEDGTVRILKEGDAEITASVPESTEYLAESASYTIHAAPAAVSVEAGTWKVIKTYDGTTDAGELTGEPEITGILEEDTEVKVEAEPETYTDPNVGGQSEIVVKLRLTGEGSGNYQLKETELEVPCQITPRKITPDIRVSGSYSYTGEAVIPEFTVFYESEDGGEAVLDESMYTASFEENTNAGTGIIRVTAKEGENDNYTWDEAEAEFTIEKAAQKLSFEEAVLEKSYGDAPFVNALSGAAEGSRVSYHSSDPSVADVDESGTVQILGAGTAVITADAAATANYTAGSASYTIHVAEQDEPAPPEPVEEEYRTEIKEGITEVPEALKAIESLNTPEKIETAMRLSIEKLDSAIPAENTVVYDVQLLVNVNQTGWVPATEENFPEEGITVTLPYPAGTGKETHDFTVAHMFTHDMNGNRAGEVEYPSVTETEEGVSFRVYALSPIALGWKEAGQTADEDDGGSADQEKPGQEAPKPDAGNDGSSSDKSTASAATGDDVPAALYLVLLAAGAAGICAVLSARRTRKK